MFSKVTATIYSNIYQKGLSIEERMISRTWYGAVPMKHKQEFYEYELITGVEETKNTRGNLSTFLKVVDQGEYCHFFLCSLGEDIEAIKSFAGENFEIAVTYPEDEKTN